MPFERFHITSTLPAPDLEARLRLSVTAPRWFAQPSSPFVGTVAGDHFRVMRVMPGRDSFNPVIYGRFVPSGAGTQIRGFMTFHPAVWTLMAAWTAAIGRILATNRNTSDTFPALLFLVIPWIMALPMFYTNADGSLRLLVESLNAKRTASLGV